MMVPSAETDQRLSTSIQARITINDYKPRPYVLHERKDGIKIDIEFTVYDRPVEMVLCPIAGCGEQFEDTKTACQNHLLACHEKETKYTQEELVNYNSQKRLQGKSANDQDESTGDHEDKSAANSVRGKCPYCSTVQRELGRHVQTHCDRAGVQLRYWCQHCSSAGWYRDTSTFVKSHLMACEAKSKEPSTAPS